jgi:hypothetical protein
MLCHFRQVDPRSGELWECGKYAEPEGTCTGGGCEQWPDSITVANDAVEDVAEVLFYFCVIYSTSSPVDPHFDSTPLWLCL